MNNRIGRFLKKVIMNNMNFCHVLKTNGVQTELQTNRVSCRAASLLKNGIVRIFLVFNNI